MKISEAKFAGSSTRVGGRPSPRLPEIAFIGRSNVGKSSLINMLTGNGKLAKTSSTPGKTKLVNHFLINGEWYLVDLPGYGYASMPPAERQKLHDIISDYLSFSDEMALLFVLIDSRHKIQRNDMDFLDEMGEHGIPVAIIFTKGDKMGPVARQKQIDENLAQLREKWEELPPYFISSSTTGMGKEEILDYIGTVIAKIGETTQTQNTKI
jgi:GTP-binding protein